MASHGVSRSSGTAVRTEEARQKELQQIAAYKDLTNVVNKKIAEKEYTLDVLGLVTKLLNENPEYYTIWNHRRRILSALFAGSTAENDSNGSAEQLIQDDILLTFALLRKFPKCYWIWNHRDWLLNKAESELGADTGRQLWAGELQIVSKMLHVDSRNFHAWSYRRFVVQQLKRLASTTHAQTMSTKTLTESEFDYTTKMIKTNLSNFSAWHNRSKLIPLLLDERNADSTARRTLLASELDLICEAINTDPFDQSIWFYHQYLMSTLSPNCPPSDQIVQDLSNSERQKYYEHEMEYIREILDDEADCKWIYEALLFLARAYLEVEAGTKLFTTKDMRAWLDELNRLDPLRRGRWRDLADRLNI
ncbi:protein prenylyltransferase [Periconia macrospinosa]|uniref:Geranylgeranyl transferase type-2 subunit alpha n=1 Tax=Periconia macrospinosa TaxID=97972 RepID=A0A2V1DET6_9PLEO|nr:protein prenylyltransferase [Periconia macrospinosa]